MINSLIDSYFSAYLLANVVLLPLVVLYLASAINASPLKLRLILHKALVVGLCLLPLLITATTRMDAAEKARTHTSNATTELSAPASPGVLSSSLSMAIPRQTNEMHKAELVDFQYYWSALGTIAGEVLALLSLAGLAVLIGRALLQYAVLRRVRETSSSITDCEGFAVFRSDKVATAFSTGLLSRRVYLPLTLPEPTREIILKHEVNHFRCRHHWWLWAETLLAHTFWFNPLHHVLRRQGELLREMECDEKTVLEVGKLDYSQALLETAERLTPCASAAFMAHPWRGKTLKQRIENILGERRNPRRRWLKNSLLATATVLVTGYSVSAYLDDRFLEQLVLSEVNRNYASHVNAHGAVTYEKIPAHTIRALLVQEDRNFFTHNGVDTVAAVRGASRHLENVLFNANNSPVGGSTITVQLAKNLLGSNRRTIREKLLQLKAADIIEEHFSKEEIVEMFLTKIYFGNGAYGLHEATRRYFNKDYSELTLEESALLVSIIPAPSLYNPVVDPETAAQRQQWLLARLDAG